jgi:general secretion pathway protein K
MVRRSRPRRNLRPEDGGYALLAAILAVMAFAYMAYEVLAADRGAIAAVSGRLTQARLTAAADAGMAMAVHGLAADDLNARWSNDGRTRQLEFDGIDLTISVEDERGKAPLSGMDNTQARALFAGAGATGDQLDHLVAEFRDWQSDPAAGVDMSGLVLPTPDGRPVRHGPFRTVDEMASLQDMTPQIFARVAPVTTAFFEETGGFDVDHAAPLAKSAMSAVTVESPDESGSETQTADDQPAEELQSRSLVGDPMTIRVVARDRSGGRAERMEIVELTGDPTTPFWVRYTQ